MSQHPRPIDDYERAVIMMAMENERMDRFRRAMPDACKFFEEAKIDVQRLQEAFTRVHIETDPIEISRTSDFIARNLADTIQVSITVIGTAPTSCDPW